VLYGAEIWGVEKRETLISAQALFWKRILGVNRNAAHCGVLQEVGSTDIRSMACIRALMYWLRCAKDLAPPLVATCYREQLFLGMTWGNIPWAMKIKNVLDILNFSNLWEGENLNDKNVYSNVSDAIKNRAHEITLMSCQEKKSLKLCRRSEWGASPYVAGCSRQARSGILWFVLGGWLTHKKCVKDAEGVTQSVCVLCGGRETSLHILYTCPATAKLRVQARLPPDMAPEEVHEVTDTALLERVGKFLCEVRTRRSEVLSGKNKRSGSE